MNIEKEDVIFPTLALIVFFLFFVLLLKYNSILLTLIFLLIGMTVLVVVYTYIYLRKNRDKKILKIRSLFLIPIYLVALYHLYLLNIGYDFSKGELLLPQGLVIFLMILESLVEYVYRRKIKK